MLEDKVALVTGGTSGIGRATALAKLNEVIAFGAAGQKWSSVAQEVAKLLQQAFPVQADRLNHTGTIAIRTTEPEYRQIITNEPLTERELEVLQLIVDGYSNAAIARRLYIAKGTARTHVRNILKKLYASDF